MPCISADRLERFACDVLTAAGARPDEATIVAHSLVESDLRGHESHGVLRLPSYVEKLAKKEVKPGAELLVIRESPTTVMGNGNWGFGQVQMRRLMDRAAGKASDQGVAIGTLFHVTHVGRLGEYSERAAEAGLASIMMANAHSSRRVAPPGARASRIGTNPIAFGVPTPHGPLILDFGTAAAAEGKIRQRMVAGVPCPDGWLLDNTGHPTNDPAALYTNPPGAILPMGGVQSYKGFGLALMIEIFAGALSGGMCIREKPLVPLGNCVFLMLVDPASLGGIAHLYQEVDDLMGYLRNSPKTAETAEILLPGEPERRTYAQRLRDGVPVEEKTWEVLIELAGRLGVDAARERQDGEIRRPDDASHTITAIS